MYLKFQAFQHLRHTVFQVLSSSCKEKKIIIIVHSSVWPSALPAHHSAKQEINYVIFEAMSSDNDQDFI